MKNIIKQSKFLRAYRISDAIYSCIFVLLFFSVFPSGAAEDSAPNLYNNLNYSNYYSTRIYVPAVSLTLRGFITAIDIEIRPGKGRIYISSQPFSGIGLQSSEKVAVKVAEEYTGIPFKNYDVSVAIDTNASFVDGNSAGSALAIGIISAILNRTIPNDIMITGTIEEDGSIGRVGGIYWKAKAAAEAGARILLIPEGQARESSSFFRVKDAWKRMLMDKRVVVRDLRKYAKEKWNLTIIEVGRIEYALKFFWNEVDLDDMIYYTEDIRITPDINVSDNPMRDIANFKIKEAKLKYEFLRKQIQNSRMKKYFSHKLEQVNKTIKESIKFFDKKNYYIAADRAFSACIETDVMWYFIRFVRTGSNYGYLSEMSREARAKLKSVYVLINPDMIQDNMGGEWVISSQQRYCWAKARLDNIDKIKKPEKALYTLAAVNQWIDSVILFSKIAYTIASGGGYRLDNISAEKMCRNRLKNLRGRLTEKTPDIIYYLYKSAELEMENRWYLTCNIELSAIHYLEELQGAGGEIEELYIKDVKEILGELKKRNMTYIWISSYLDVLDIDEGDKANFALAIATSRAENRIKFFKTSQIRLTYPPMPSITPIKIENRINWSFKSDRKISIPDSDFYIIIIVITLLSLILILLTNIEHLKKRGK